LSYCKTQFWSYRPTLSPGEPTGKKFPCCITTITDHTCHGVVQAEEPEDSRVAIKITINIKDRQEDRNTGATQANIRQRPTKTESNRGN